MAAQPPDGLIDLHSHSRASDGEYVAAQVAELAASAGVKVWALCDHDTVAGLPAAQQAADRIGLRLVPGIEPALKRFEDLLAERRRVRMEQIVEKLATVGVRLRVEDIEKHSGGKTIGRPHVARAIVDTGIVSSVKEAFDRYLGEGRPAYVQRYRLDAEEAVRLVHAAGGTTTVAHPGQDGLERGELERLRAAGVVGIEVVHVEHNPSVREKYRRLAEALDLVPTAGSDYHGPAVSPDRRFGDVTMSAADLARLEARRP